MSASRLRRHQRRARRAVVRERLRPKLGEQLLAAWDHCWWVWNWFCVVFETPHDAPRYIAAREYIIFHEYHALLRWVRPLELLVRRIVLAAALAIDVVLKPVKEAVRTARKRRRVLVWPDRPSTWIARFRMVPPRPRERAIRKPAMFKRPRCLPAMPLARRLEALRRVLANPEPHAHRFAIKLARLAARNRTANRPLQFRLCGLHYKDARGHCGRMVTEGMDIVMPIARAGLERLGLHYEPG